MRKQPCVKRRQERGQHHQCHMTDVLESKLRYHTDQRHLRAVGEGQTDDDRDSATPTNAEAIESRDRANEELVCILYMATTGSAGVLMQRFEPKHGPRADDHAAWHSLINKYDINSAQQPQLPMRKLDSMQITLGQDSGLFFVKVQQLADQLAELNETVSDAPLADILLQGLTDDYELMRFHADRDPDLFCLDDITSTVCNTCINRLVRSDRFKTEGGAIALVASLQRRQATPDDDKCLNCGKSEHWNKDCRKKQELRPDCASSNHSTCKGRKKKAHSRAASNGGAGARQKLQSGVHCITRERTATASAGRTWPETTRHCRAKTMSTLLRIPVRRRVWASKILLAAKPTTHLEWIHRRWDAYL